MVITLGFLVLIAIAFASSDVANTNMFGGVSGGDRVVRGNPRIDAADLKENLIGNMLDHDAAAATRR